MSNDFGSPSGYGTPQQPYGQPHQQQQQYQQGGPSFGYPPPGYGAPQGPPPKVKPSVGWIVGVWLLFVLSVIIGFVGFAGGLFNAVTEAAPTSSFGPDQKTTVSIDPANKPAIYVAAAKGTNFECQIEGAPGTVKLQRPSFQQTVTADGQLWELALRIGVDKAGDYPITCTTSGGVDAKFGVGKEIVADSVIGGTLMLFGVPGIGFLLAVIVTIVVLVKRSGARKRQAAAAAAQWGQPGAYGR